MRYWLTLIACVPLVGQTIAIFSAASFRRDAPIAPNMIVTAFSAALTGADGYAVAVRDSTGSERGAAAFGVANGQLSFVTPGGTALGSATITIRRGESVLGTAAVTIAATAPGIFTANNSGSGVPSALAMLVDAVGSRTTMELFQQAGSTFLPRPLLSGSSDVYLMLFGTGIRGYRDSVTAAIAGRAVPVAGVAMQGEFAGLDQVNLGPLPRDLSGGRGEV